ncbi:hypothetical protein [Caballeronia sp. Lep1P3]|uniref:hypothetical protein n=1 Tax=Caballeronia sp. Lep1P3 TaxID=2878150 RepID=UPI001FD4C7B0|nr:hypothetical protein [Caballeronia sp. Lep1P3]
MKHELRAALMPFVIAALGPCALVASSAAHAAHYSDAATGTRQPGGITPAEANLLGSPDAYADPYAVPYGAPVDGTAKAAQGISPTDKLLAQQNGYVGNPGAGAQLRRAPRNGDAKAMLMPEGAAATLYPAPGGYKAPPKAARARNIYRSPY